MLFLLSKDSNSILYHKFASLFINILIPMLLFKKVNDLRQHLDKQSSRGHKIGFVPTMGALHEGHISLISESIRTTEITVCSIFVNPTQFNESTDLEKYPRTPEKDIVALAEAGNHILFMPPVAEIYPEDYKQSYNFDFGELDQPMEGENRPGHFQGMAQVVSRLLDIVQPHALFMGQKDFQQFAIVQKMLPQMNSSCKLVRCPIIREEDGLAMSSRNSRLSPNQRSLAPNIHRTLLFAKKNVHDLFPAQIQEKALKMLSIEGMKPEYFEIVDGYTLRSIELFEDTSFAVACTAVWVGDIRLIDNMILKNHVPQQ